MGRNMDKHIASSSCFFPDLFGVDRSWDVDDWERTGGIRRRWL